MVKTGLDVWEADGFARLRGRRVGLVTNPTGTLAGGATNIEAMRRAGVRLVALYGPEHGVRGDVPAGQYIASYGDKKTGLPVYSLYGKTRTPTPAMLKNVEILLFDIQDIGARSYTYLSTLGAVLDGAARAGVAVVVLDRPNPCGGLRVEGGPTRAGFSSFISRYKTAYLHGLTLGEAARMLVGEGWTGRPELSVVPCSGLTRAQTWPDLGRSRWIPTSPNIPRWESALLYAATGIIGELSSVSVGIGVPGSQFALCGAPGVDAHRAAQAVERLGGWSATPAAWTPQKGTHAGKRCTGVRLTLSDPNRAELCRPNFALLGAMGLRLGESGGQRMFDLACGTDAVRRAFLRGATEADLWAEFQRGVDDFDARRRKYLLYS